MSDPHISHNELSAIVDHLIKRHKQNMTEQSTLRNIILKLEAEVATLEEKIATLETVNRDLHDTVEAQRNYRENNTPRT